MTYRVPDPQRSEELAREQARQQAADDAAVAAMKDPLHRIRVVTGLPARSAKQALVASLVGLGFPMVCVVIAPAQLGDFPSMVLVITALIVGPTAGVTAVVLGFRARRSGHLGLSLLAIVLGLLAVPWGPVAAFLAFLMGVGMMR